MSARPRLQSLIVEITPRCNHACLHCYNVWQAPLPNGGSYPLGELDTSQTLRLLAKVLEESDCQHITLTGGEPLLRQDLPQILDFLSQRRLPVTLISNGRLLTPARIADLLARRVSLFELPLLGCQRATHDWLSGSAGAFDAVLSAMAHLRRQGGQFIAVFVITRQNAAELYDVIRLAFAFGARGLMLNRFNPGGRGLAHLAELLPTVEQVHLALQTAQAASQEFGFPISCAIPIQPCLIDTSPFTHLGFGFCAAGTQRAYYTLDPLGNLRPCNHTPTILGNLFENDFADLIASPTLSDFTAAIPPFCADCPQRFNCQGGCKASAQVCYGRLDAEEPFLRQTLPTSASL